MKQIFKLYQSLLAELKSQLDNSQKVYILPTKFGLAFFSVNFISFIIALAFGHQFSYIFSITLLVTFVTSAMITNQYMKNVKIKASSYYAITEAGVPFNLSLAIENNDEKVIDVNLKNFDDKKRVQVNNNKIATSFTLHREDVGVFEKEKFKLYSTYPLFLFRAWKNVEVDCTSLVYPKSSDVHSSTSMDKEQGDHEIEHVKYQPGDNFSKVDWKIFAKRDELFTKKDLGDDSELSIIDENFILKNGIRGLGVICKMIHHHISHGHSFIFKNIHHHEKQYSKTSHMVELMKKLIVEYYV